MSFTVKSRLGVIIKLPEERWNLIINVKHRYMKGKEYLVKSTLEDPDEVRRSQSDLRVYLYYKKIDKYFLCAVIKHLNSEGFVITAYLTDKIKEGETIWQKQK